MTCREFRDELRRPQVSDLGDAARRPQASDLTDAARRPQASDLSDAARRHAASCPDCAAEARAALLLRLGSGVAEGAAPRAGFEERLLARLASDPAPSGRPAWNGGFELLVRPALAVAATLAVLCAGFYLQAAPQREADLASLVENDPVFAPLLAGDPGAVFEGPQGAPAVTEEP
jgi:hypothetical protein